jgi:2-oxoglutarate ferredoxin oxidoreductase subunit delta
MIPAFERYQQGSAALLVNRAWCKGCNLCVAACPSHILALDAAQLVRVGDIAKCIFCGLCAVRCPDFVFILERLNGKGAPAWAAGAGSH